MAAVSRSDIARLVLRVGVGGILAAHGAQKLFGWFGGHGVTGTGKAMEAMGFKPGKPSALAAGISETAGGAMLILGLATPATGAATASTMAVAATAHGPKGLFASNGGYEYPAVLGLCSAALAIAGSRQDLRRPRAQLPLVEQAGRNPVVGRDRRHHRDGAAAPTLRTGRHRGSRGRSRSRRGVRHQGGDRGDVRGSLGGRGGRQRDRSVHHGHDRFRLAGHRHPGAGASSIATSSTANGKASTQLPPAAKS